MESGGSDGEAGLTSSRAIRTRAPVPIVMTLLAAASAGYYGKEVAEERERGVLFK